MEGDVRIFDRFARLYDLCMPAARRSKLATVAVGGFGYVVAGVADKRESQVGPRTTG